ncbi:transcription antitermination factor NusB [Actinomyces vulturis]|uniref:transcription antitermination factor NusB n=1 Tax=Actinomyces vulturis TaxID=1857645 RepID=UPI0008319E65|nr:transcription antitermination factor NusB [Actinomyces vulturis]
MKDSSSPASKHQVTARTKARRRAVEVLFEADQRGLESTQALRDLSAERVVTSANHTQAPEYTRTILTGVCDHIDDIDSVLASHSQQWSLDRMPAVDRAIARVAVWEILFNDEVDGPVAVDEAMTLARLLSTDDSPRFLNGLLGRIADLSDTIAV